MILTMFVFQESNLSMSKAPWLLIKVFTIIWKRTYSEKSRP